MRTKIFERLQSEYKSVEQLNITSTTDITSNELAQYEYFAQLEFIGDGENCAQTALVSKEGNVYLSEYQTQLETEQDVIDALQAGTIW